MDNIVIRRPWTSGQMLTVDNLYGQVITGEAGAHTFQIYGQDSIGEAVAISGTISGTFLRSDGSTVALTGSVSDGEANITLDDQCYDVPGRFVLAIHAVNSGTDICIYAAVGNVFRTESNVVVDPGTILPSISTLISQIETAVASVPADYSSLLADIAPTYSSSSTYAVGDYVWYNGDLYRCTTAITTAEAWTSSHWSAVTVTGALIQQSEEIANSKISKTIDLANATEHYYITADGTMSSSSAWNTVTIDDVTGITKIEGRFGSATETNLAVAFYNSSVASSSSFVSGVAIGTSGSLVQATVPDSAVMAVVTTRPASYADYYAVAYRDIYADAEKTNQIDAIDKIIDTSKLVHDLDFTSVDLNGYIDSTGAYNASNSWRAIVLQCNSYMKKIEASLGSATATHLGIAFYDKDCISTDSFISGVAIGASGSVISATIPSTAAIAVIATRPASYADYYAKLYLDIGSDAYESIKHIESYNLDSGASEYPLYYGHYNSQNNQLLASTSYVSTAKIPTDGNEVICVKCPGYKVWGYNFTAMYSAVQKASIQEIVPNNYVSFSVDGFAYFALVIAKTDGSEITSSNLATIKSNLSIIKGFDQHAAFTAVNSELITGANADREQLLSNFIWPINTTGGSAISNANKMLCLLHFSDIHGDKTNLSRIMDYYNAHSGMIDDVLFTGDYIKTKFSNDFTFWTGVSGSDKILGIIGNHDCSNSDDHYAIDVTQQQLYEKFFSGIADWGCTYEANQTYWYKDYTTQGIRLIGLNSSLDSTDTATQLSWLVSTLADAVTNSLDVCIAIHFPVSGAKVDSLFTSLDDDAPSSHCVDSDIIDAVDDFIENGGNFICYITGHTHTDFVLSATARNTQICFTVTTAKNENGYYGDQARESGTRSNDAFNLISIDKIGHVVKLIRIGANCDHYVRPRNTLAINYLTGTVISQS